MNRLTQSRQQCLMLLAAAALVLSLGLSACGSPANAANSGVPTSNPANTQQQYQSSGSGSQNNSSGVQNTDQQIQGLLRHLDGSQNDVNNADAGASQDGGQP